MGTRIQQIRTARSTVGEFLRFRIWDPEISRMPRWQGFVYRQLRVAVIFVKGFTAGRIQLRASAMTFTTLLTIGPVLVIALSVLQAFGALRGLQDQLESFLLDNLSPGSQEQFRGWLYTFFESVRSGAFRGISLMVLFGGMLGLLGSIEQAFNDIWGVHRGRSLFQRFSTYTTLMVFGPILIGISLSFTATVETWALRSWIATLSPVVREFFGVGMKLLPPILTGFAFTLLYTIMPNVKVNVRASLPAGLVAGVLWEVSKIGYTTWLRHASHYGTLYGSLAAVPLFLIWVYVSWLVVLFGAQLAFARDAADDFRLEEGALKASVRERLRVAFHLVMASSRSYRSESGAPDLIRLSHRLRLPLRLVRSVAETLVDGGLVHLVQGSRRELVLVPARTPERITVYDVVTCMVNRGTSDATATTRRTLPGASAERVMAELDAGLRDRWTGISFGDLMDEEDHKSGQDVLPFPVGARRRDD